MRKFDCVIIGAGPGGMSAALYLSRTSKKVALIEKSTPGGRMLQANEVSNYIGVGTQSGTDIAVSMFSQLDLSKIEYIQDEVLEVIPGDEIVLQLRNETISSEKVIIASGFTNRLLGAINEEKFVGMGISYCALCDAPLTKNKDILVYGSSNQVLEETKYLATLANKIYFLTNKKFENLPENIEVFNKTKILSFEGGFKLSKVVCEIEGQTKEFNVDMAFIFNGYSPSNNFVKNLNIIDKVGLIEVNEFYETKIKNIYAIGDVTNRPIKQIATAVGDGAFVASKLI